MRLKTISTAPGRVLVLATCFWVTGFSASAVSQNNDMADQLPEGEGKGYVQTICTSCHGLSLIVYQRKSPAGWEATVYDMLGRISAGMDREAEIISKYLAKSFPVESSPPPPAADQAPSPSTEGDTIRIYHQVLFRFKPEVSEQEIEKVLESGREMFRRIPQVATMAVGKVLQADSEFPYGLVTTFRNEQDMKLYQEHPDHLAWITDVYRPAVEETKITDIMAP